MPEGVDLRVRRRGDGDDSRAVVGARLRERATARATDWSADVSRRERASEGRTVSRPRLRINYGSGRRELSENSIHYSSGEKDLSVRYGHRSVVNDRTVESVDQVLHPRPHLHVPCQESLYVSQEVLEMLLGENHRGNELLEVALEPPSPKSD